MQLILNKCISLKSKPASPKLSLPSFDLATAQPSYTHQPQPQLRPQSPPSRPCSPLPETPSPPARSIGLGILGLSHKNPYGQSSYIDNSEDGPFDGLGLVGITSQDDVSDVDAHADRTDHGGASLSATFMRELAYTWYMDPFHKRALGTIAECEEDGSEDGVTTWERQPQCQSHGEDARLGSDTDADTDLSDRSLLDRRGKGRGVGLEPSMLDRVARQRIEPVGRHRQTDISSSAPPPSPATLQHSFPPTYTPLSNHPSTTGNQTIYTRDRTVFARRPVLGQNNKKRERRRSNTVVDTARTSKDVNGALDQGQARSSKRAATKWVKERTGMRPKWR